MIRRATVVYIIILLLLAGAYFYLKNRSQPTNEAAVTPEITEQVSYLFTADEGIPTDIRIQSKAGETVEVARDAQNLWALTAPIEAKADQSAAEAAATQLTTMSVLDKVPTVDRKVVGLEPPEYSMTVKFKGGGERTVNIGVVTPSESGYYVQNSSGGDVVIVSKSSVDALLMMLTTPPYLETLTPSPAASETPLPATASLIPPTNETTTPQP
jgi:uncharacterized protein DUF4340